MQIEYIYWLFSVVVGTLIGLLARPESWRSIAGLALLGGCFVFAGVFLGIHNEFSTVRLLQLVLFDKQSVSIYGLTEYRLITLGYAFIVGGMCLCLRKIYGRKRKSEQSGPDHE